MNLTHIDKYCKELGLADSGKYRSNRLIFREKLRALNDFVVDVRCGSNQFHMVQGIKPQPPQFGDYYVRLCLNGNYGVFQFVMVHRQGNMFTACYVFLGWEKEYEMDGDEAQGEDALMKSPLRRAKAYN